MFDAFRQDLRHALRHLRRSPTFTLGAMLTLALGIGVSAEVFSALNALVLRPAPIKDPSGLIGVWPIDARGQQTSTLAPVADLLQDGPLESVCAYGYSPVGVEANGIPVYAAVEIVTHQYFATIGVPPLLGRVFTAEEAPASRPGMRVVVIGYDFWQKLFGGAPDVVGRSFQTDGDPVTVIGVMPRGFRGLRVDDGVDIIAPFGTVRPSPANRLLASYILGRLRPGVTLAAARAELASRWPPIMDRVVPTTLSPAEQRNLRDVTIRVDAVGTGFSILRTRYEQPLWIGSALTLGLLLLACVNVGGLALSHVVARGGELAMRTALGASGLRLARQLVLEILAVAGAGTILGIGVAWVAVKPIASALPFGGLEPTLNMTPDARVLFVTALAGLVTGLLASLLPVWLASRRETPQLHTDRTVAAASRPGRVLLVAQVAVSVALLMAAGLLTRSLDLLFHNHPGFDGTKILSARLRPLPGAYGDRAFNNGLNYYPVLLERVAALPGVRSVGYARAFGNADRRLGALINAPDRSLWRSVAARPSAARHVAGPGPRIRIQHHDPRQTAATKRGQRTHGRDARDAGGRAGGAARVCRRIQPLCLRRCPPHARDRRARRHRPHARRSAADGAARKRDTNRDWCFARYPHRHHSEPMTSFVARRTERIGSTGCRIGRGVFPDAHDRGGTHSRAPRRTSRSRRRSPR